jgi:hypothetical protein
MVGLVLDKLTLAASPVAITTPVDRFGSRWLSVQRAPAPGLFPIRTAFPDLVPGRHPHCSFRGLLKLYAYYGLPDCSPTFPWTSLARFRPPPLPVLAARQLSNLTINYSSGSFPPGIQPLWGTHKIACPTLSEPAFYHSGLRYGDFKPGVVEIFSVT